MDQLQKVYEDLLEKIRKVAGHTNRNTQDIHELIARSQQDEQLENTIKIITANYSNARAYANVVIIAGYAAFFAAWGFLRDDIPHRASLFALLLMMISATVFVLFEVGKMIWVSLSIRRHSQGLHGDDPLGAVRKLGETEQREAIVIGRIWMWVLITTLVCGLAALGILAFNLVELVIQGPAPSSSAPTR